MRKGSTVLRHTAIAVSILVLSPAGPISGPTSGIGGLVRMAEAQPKKFENADQLLSALETADASLRTLNAELRYDRSFAIQGDRQVRTGTLYFVTDEPKKVDGKRQRRFAIRFEQLAVGERIEKETKDYIFDGSWLVEREPSRKRFNKRQIVPEGQSFDPLRIGEGPMPIPIGQKKADILKRYDAKLIPAEDGLEDAKERKFVNKSYQLLLTPRAELAETDEFLELRLWYRTDSDGMLLPRMARTKNRSGDESLVQLINVKVNDQRGVPDGLFSTEAPKSGWDVTVQPWRGSGGDAPKADVPGVDVPGLETSVKVLPADEKSGVPATAPTNPKAPNAEVPSGATKPPADGASKPNPANPPK